MKYISMKMDPKGSSPPAATIMAGLRYHWRLGMGDGMRFTLSSVREGGSAAPGTQCEGGWWWCGMEGGDGGGRWRGVM